MTRYGIIHTLQHLLGGQSLARIRMNVALASERISGHAVDVGGGRSPDYVRYLAQDVDTKIEPIDGSISGIDFENDPLPYGDGAVDSVLMCNILEHVYNHAALLTEARRILRSRGRLVGFVPFWVGYHPDPHDYFRYTAEALTRMLTDAGFSNLRIVPVGDGPFLANFNTISLSFPRIARPLLYLPYAVLDSLMLFLRPRARNRFPLGFMFSADA